MTTIGAQGYTLRSQFADLGITETIRRVAQIGYRSIEISAVPMTPANVAELRAASSELGVSIDATTAPLHAPAGKESLENDLAKIADDAIALGSRHIRIGMFAPRAFVSAEAVEQFARQADDAAVQLADRGLVLCYHNHAIEFGRDGGTRLLDAIVAAAPNLQLEIDVHWVHRGGGDPVTVLRQYAERAALVHLKDYRIGLPTLTQIEAAEAEPGSVPTLLTNVQFAEVGEGALAFGPIVETAIEIGAAHLFVEQDATYDRDAFDALALSHRNLTELGFGSLL